MSPKSLPKWATRVIAAILIAAQYLVNARGLVPATLYLGPVHVLAALNGILFVGAAVGLSGPALWPQLAAFLGNPGATSPPPPPAA